jgi:hypothetical protein
MSFNSFFFSTDEKEEYGDGDVMLRNITDIDKMEYLSETAINRLKPFIKPISKEEFLDMNIEDEATAIDYVLANNWSQNDDLEILTKLSSKPFWTLDHKIFEEMLNDEYISKDGKKLNIDNVESFDIEIYFKYKGEVNFISVGIKNVVFNKEVKNSGRQNDIIISSSAMEYYYDIDSNFLGYTIFVKELMIKEYVLNPIMFFDPNLYLEVRNRINKLIYDCEEQLK